MIAVDDASGEVAGYASLIFAAGSTTVAYHDMTAVRRAYRGRGIAGALKRATIAWAVAHGLEALDTGNDELNAPMRAVNLALGYRPAPDWIGLQGPLAARTTPRRRTRPAYFARDHHRPQRHPAPEPAPHLRQPPGLRRLEEQADPVRAHPDRPVGAAVALRRRHDADGHDQPREGHFTLREDWGLPEFPAMLKLYGRALHRVDAGWINAFGWSNIGIERYFDEYFPRTADHNRIVSVGGFSADELSSSSRPATGGRSPARSRRSSSTSPATTSTSRSGRSSRTPSAGRSR